MPAPFARSGMDASWAPCDGAVHALRVAVSKQMRHLAQSKATLKAIDDPEVMRAMRKQALMSPTAAMGRSVTSPSHGGGGGGLSASVLGMSMSAVGSPKSLRPLDEATVSGSPPRGVSFAANSPNIRPSPGPAKPQDTAAAEPVITHDDILAAKLICAVLDSDLDVLRDLMRKLDGVKGQRDQWQRSGGTSGKLKLLPSIARAQLGLELSRHPRPVVDFAPYTLLHVAAVARDPVVVELLLTHEHAVRLVGSLDVDVHGPHAGETALHLAAAEGSPVVVRALLAAGASPHIGRRRNQQVGGKPAQLFGSAAVLPLHDAVARAAAEGVTPHDIATAATTLRQRRGNGASQGDVGAAQALGGDEESGAAAGSVAACAEACVLLRYAAGGSDASTQPFLSPEANALLAAVAVAVRPSAVYAPATRLSHQGRKSKPSPDRDGNSSSPAGSPVSFAQKHRRLHEAVSPSFATVLSKGASSLAGTSVGGLADLSGTLVRGGEYDGVRLDHADAPSPHRRPAVIGEYVTFTRATPMSLLVTALQRSRRGAAAFAPMEPGSFTVAKPKELKRRAKAGESTAAIEDNASLGSAQSPSALSALSPRQSQQPGSPAASFVVGRSAASFRMTPAHEPSRSVTPQPDVRAGPLAGTLGAAAVTPERGQDGADDETPSFMRQRTRTVRRPHKLDAEASASSSGKGASWGAPGPGSEGGRYGIVVGAVKVGDAALAQHGTGFLTDVLLLVRVEEGAGVRADPPARDWAAQGVDSPASWCDALVALCRRRPGAQQQRQGGDLAIVPASDARAIRSASDCAMIDHLLRATRSGASVKQPPPAASAATPEPPSKGDHTPPKTKTQPDPGDEMAKLLRRRRRTESTRFDADRVALAKAAGLDWAPPGSKTKPAPATVTKAPNRAT